MAGWFVAKNKTFYRHTVERKAMRGKVGRLKSSSFTKMVRTKINYGAIGTIRKPIRVIYGLKRLHTRQCAKADVNNSID